MILEGVNAISTNRKLMGATDPSKAEENTIRKLFGISIDKNSVHGSDSQIMQRKKSISFFKAKIREKFLLLPLDKPCIPIIGFSFKVFSLSLELIKKVFNNNISGIKFLIDIMNSTPTFFSFFSRILE